jgi:hypothetical protein
MKRKGGFFFVLASRSRAAPGRLEVGVEGTIHDPPSSMRSRAPPVRNEE